jgi:hypothetical protein
MGSFGRAQALDLSNDLERGYEAALLIQSIELEHYNDRPVRPELDLRIPRASQAQLLRRFRAALEVCRQTLASLESHRGEIAGQEVRQLQLIQTVVARYSDRRDPLPTISRSPEVLPRSLIGVVDQVRRQLDPDAEANVVAGFRRRRDSTLVSLRILLLLILVPVLVQQVSRTYVISPLVDRFAPDNAFLTYPKPKLEEQAVEKLRVFQAEIEFDALLKGKPLPSREELQTQLALKADELKEEADLPTELRDAHKSLEDRLKAPSFYEQLAEIDQLTRKLEQAYEERRQAAQQALNIQVQQRVQQLEQAPGFGALEPERQNQLKAPLEQKANDAEALDLVRLRDQPAMLEGVLRQQEQAAQNWAFPEQDVSTVSVRELCREPFDADGLEDVLNRIRQRCEEELGNDRKVLLQ